MGIFCFPLPRGSDKRQTNMPIIITGFLYFSVNVASYQNIWRYNLFTTPPRDKAVQDNRSGIRPQLIAVCPYSTPRIRPMMGYVHLYTVDIQHQVIETPRTNWCSTNASRLYLLRYGLFCRTRWLNMGRCPSHNVRGIGSFCMLYKNICGHSHLFKD